MQDDQRCCGTGIYIIDAGGRYWCGQHWDGEKMCFAQATRSADTESSMASDTHASSLPDKESSSSAK